MSVVIAPPALDPPAPGGGALSVQVIGPVRVMAGGREVAVQGTKARALLAYLALMDGHQEFRGRLSRLIWADREEHHARAALRQSVFAVRDALDRADASDILKTSRDAMAFAPGRVRTDLNEVLGAAKAGIVHRRLREVPRPDEVLLQDVHDLGSSWDRWVRAQRESALRSLSAALAAAMHNGSARKTERIEAAEALVRLDPLNEEASRVAQRLRDSEA
jgi:DNA-binding SARP family transcriptional activator